ncbi:MAG: adenylate/guanylate cyclase domain-containing protein [Flavobacteriales bacterium]
MRHRPVLGSVRSRVPWVGPRRLFNILLLLALLPAKEVVASAEVVVSIALVDADSLSGVQEYRQAIQLLDSALAAVPDDPEAQGKLMLRKALLLQQLGENDRALRVLYQALSLETKLGEGLGLAEVLNNIGAIQHEQRNFEKAQECYERSGKIYERLGLQRELGKYWNNMGSLNEDMGEPRKALAFHHRSLKIWQALQDNGWAGISYMHLGSCLQKLGKLDSARTYLNASIELLERRKSQYQLSLVYIIYGDNENKAGNHREALRYCNQALAITQRMKARLFEQRACECLSLAYEGLGKKGKALEMFRRSTDLRDSLFGVAKVQELTRVEMDHDFAQRELADSLLRSKKQVEDRLRQQEAVSKERDGRNVAIFTSFAVLLLAGALWSRLRLMRLSRGRVQRERERSDRLLLNILPASVAQELKDSGKALAREYAGATILFSDFKDFTRISQTMSPQALVEELDTCFKAFDSIITAKGIEKIKTIGDAYMCVGGLPDPQSTTPADVVRAGLEMQAFITARKAERERLGLPAFEMRVGLHSGPVVAGIVGLKKFAYDIWGDAVNTACAMERSSKAGKVNISAATYERVRREPDLVFTPRGKVEAKGKGELEMYFVDYA